MGRFFEGRYKSIAILDEESLLSVCAYIDLNPVAAGIVALPEESPHTSIKERVEHAKAEGRIADVSEIRDGKASVSAEVENIFTRLGSSAESWGARLLKLSGPRLIGRFLAASRDRLREIAQRLGVRHVANVG